MDVSSDVMLALKQLESAVGKQFVSSVSAENKALKQRVLAKERRKRLRQESQSAALSRRKSRYN